MRLYFVRHGESEANTRRVISNRESPFGLMELGRQQANSLADKLKDIPITAIFSSPVLRARKTADILSQACVANLIKLLRPCVSMIVAFWKNKLTLQAG